MKKIIIFLLVVSIFLSGCVYEKKEVVDMAEKKISLPKDFVEGELSVFESIKTRRSIRSYSREPMTLRELSTLLFATQGITSEDGYRAAPSAGATYPIETYILVNNVEGLDRGIYHYIPEEHALEVIRPGEVSISGQSTLMDAAVNFIWTAVFIRTTRRYGDRGIRYIHMEAGHISENLYLQANSMGMGVVAIGAFDDNSVNQLLGVDGERESVIYINAVGKK